ncbi:hypothetical protein [Salibacterium halotolerans]|uniref:hypothetical protein n=1 Tax=Salibacterium halotolerans TaxID=1884432 RepID=UPI001FCE1A0B|nr:hypothetical protein [Salibacterium halotolerans]
MRYDRLQELLETVGYIDTGRKLDGFTLLHYLTNASAHAWTGYRQSALEDPGMNGRRWNIPRFLKKRGMFLIRFLKSCSIR